MTYHHTGYILRARAEIALIRADLEREVRAFDFNPRVVCVDVLSAGEIHTKPPIDLSGIGIIAGGWDEQIDKLVADAKASVDKHLTTNLIQTSGPQPRKRRRKKK